MALAFASGSGGGGGGGVASVTAADTSIVIGGTAANPTVATGTLDVIAADHPPVAAVALNAQKITGLANGSAASDAAAFGQIPTALPPNGSAGGDLTGTYPNPSVATVSGATLTSFTPSTTGVTSVVNDAGGYIKLGQLVFVTYICQGTSNATTKTFTLPFTSAIYQQFAAGQGMNNGVALTTPPRVSLSASNATASLYRDTSGAPWTNTGSFLMVANFFYYAA